MYEVYGIDGCPYCEAAKKLLREESLPHQYHRVDDSEKSAFMDDRGFAGRDRTFPRIWRDGVLVGGYSELEAEVLLAGVQASRTSVESAHWDDDLIGGPEDFS